MDRLHLTVAATSADHEVVGHGRETAKIELDDLLGFSVRRYSATASVISSGVMSRTTSV